MEGKARWRYARITPRKARAVANLLRDKTLPEAYEICLMVPRKGSRFWKKVIDSAMANLKQRAGDAVVDPADVHIRGIWADQGPVWKRWMPRAQGRATPVEKYTSHLTVVVSEE
jgi:large subunit ribosomal protein L22